MTNELQLKSTDALWIGICFIMAAITSVVGLKLYDPILQNTSYVETAYQYKSEIICGAINELILIVCVLGTSILMFPYLNMQRRNMGIAYFGFRTFEAIFISLGIISILTILSLSEGYHNGIIKDLDTIKTIGYTFKSIHKWCFILGPNFMLAINTFIYNYVFSQKTFIPKYLTSWGIIASILVMCAAILELFGIIKQLSVWGIMFAIPIALFEMTFASWLIGRKLNYKNQDKEPI